MRFHIDTLGCKVNAYESQFYAESLKKEGFIEVSKDEPSDICIINTCTVTNTAGSKSRQRINHAKKLNPDALIVVVGCYVQFLDNQKREDMDVDLIIGAKEKSQLVSLIKQAISSKQKIDTICDVDAPFDFEAMPISAFESHCRAFLKVQDGCNQFCSYCAIPFARGRERCLDANQVVSIAKELSNKGHKEIILTGIHTGRYHNEDLNLTKLLKLLLLNTPEDVYYRVSSIEITEVTDELIELMKSNPRICHHMHIPIQSACDATLQRMNRPYTVEYFKDRMKWIRKEIPDIAISTDIITGFVQESDGEFETTYANLKDIGFSFLHVFPYSKRDGTKASFMKGEVHGNIQKERTSRLLALSSELRDIDMRKYDEIEVLIEKEENGIYSGYTNQYHPVLIKSDTILKGRIKTHWDSIKNGSYIIEGSV